MGVRIEADGDLSPDEAAAVRAAVERYAETTDGTCRRWRRAVGRTRHDGNRFGDVHPRPGGREAWQAARDRRRGTGEQAR